MDPLLLLGLLGGYPGRGRTLPRSLSLELLLRGVDGAARNVGRAILRYVFMLRSSVHASRWLDRARALHLPRLDSAALATMRAAALRMLASRLLAQRPPSRSQAPSETPSKLYTLRLFPTRWHVSLHDSPALPATPQPQKEAGPAGPPPRAAAVEGYAALACYTQLHPSAALKDQRPRLDSITASEARDAIAAWLPPP
ncbi:hypothetical protein APUTEX25_003976 [Auxenochlorella protothecoides]|uniref:Uncharacterized protein n=2 Tax=Auxenochlorella protothecoides TaxID=3075 RepID=A0A3M7KU15_AUXPR|nr:hypothetical protein APUTEX25_003976 [Auxenochlorella protothecoides]|eukprot:RMZ53837.1 hypothetical protein APUTEX25_003976 [Auxenochlorella protothecoides]